MLFVYFSEIKDFQTSNDNLYSTPVELINIYSKEMYFSSFAPIVGFATEISVVLSGIHEGESTKDN